MVLQLSYRILSKLKMFKEQKELTKQYWGRHIWSRGYCVSTVGLNEEQIRKYVKWQQEKDQKGQSLHQLTTVSKLKAFQAGVHTTASGGGS